MGHLLSLIIVPCLPEIQNSSNWVAYIFICQIWVVDLTGHLDFYEALPCILTPYLRLFCSRWWPSTQSDSHVLSTCLGIWYLSLEISAEILADFTQSLPVMLQDRGQFQSLQSGLEKVGFLDLSWLRVGRLLPLCL